MRSIRRAAHSCNATPPIPSGLSRFWLGPAPQVRVGEGLRTLIRQSLYGNQPPPSDARLKRDLRPL